MVLSTVRKAFYELGNADKKELESYAEKIKRKDSEMKSS